MEVQPEEERFAFQKGYW